MAVTAGNGKTHYKSAALYITLSRRKQFPAIVSCFPLTYKSVDKDAADVLIPLDALDVDSEEILSGANYKVCFPRWLY